MVSRSLPRPPSSYRLKHTPGHHRFGPSFVMRICARIPSVACQAVPSSKPYSCPSQTSFEVCDVKPSQLQATCYRVVQQDRTYTCPIQVDVQELCADVPVSRPSTCSRVSLTCSRGGVCLTGVPSIVINCVGLPCTSLIVPCSSCVPPYLCVQQVVKRHRKSCPKQINETVCKVVSEKVPSTCYRPKQVTEEYTCHHLDSQEECSTQQHTVSGLSSCYNRALLAEGRVFDAPYTVRCLFNIFRFLRCALAKLSAKNRTRKLTRSTRRNALRYRNTRKEPVSAR